MEYGIYREKQSEEGSLEETAKSDKCEKQSVICGET